MREKMHLVITGDTNFVIVKGLRVELAILRKLQYI